MLAIICILSWATVCFLVVGLAMRGERAIIQQRVQSLRLTLREDVEKIAPELTLPFAERVVRPMLARVASGFSKLLPTNTKLVAQKLERAGNPRNLKPLEFVGLKALSVIIFLGAGIAFALFADMEPAYRIVAIACGGIIGYAIPDSLLEQAIRERQRAIRKSMANCIDLLVVSAEAGLGFDASLAKVVERSRGPLPDEFRKVLNDMQIGRSRMDALKAMATRVAMPEITTFVAAIHQADLLGASIAHVLRVQADSVRVQRNIRARESAAKLPVKLLFPLVFFIFPAIFVVVLGPAAISIFRALSQ